YAWGWNNWGQIGNGCNGLNSHQLIPIKLKGFNNERVVMISCGACHSMALTECGHVYSWGSNYYGQLGIRKKVETINSPIIIEIKKNNKINHTFKKISCGHSHSLLLSEEGVIYAFGNNECGQIGIGSEDGSYPKPKLNEYLNNEFVVDISCGEDHSLVLTNCGEVYAWGHNYWGQIGNGCNRNQLIPIKVKGFNNEKVAMISCGSFHSMALTECGHVYSWGENEFGQLGIGNTFSQPILNQYLNNEFVVDISCGVHHSLVLTNCGEVFAWGGNYYGQIGNGCNSDQLKPIKVKGFNNERVVMISCGYWHSMALTECGHVYSWGWSGSGQLGIENTVKSNEPKFVAVIDENKSNVFVEKISCGKYHSLLLSSDGNIYVFGRNKSGELGNQK
ncbi:unnamed protein product, partial [Sphagnum balticum]